MKKVLIFIIIVAVLGFATYAIFNSLKRNETMTNGEMLQTEEDVLVIAQRDVEYFEGAKGYFVRPEQEGDYPGVVMIHENRGLRPEIILMAHELAKEGYMVLAVDLLGDVVETQEEARALTASFDQQRGIENMTAAINYLKDNGATKIASLGWCFGGRQSLELAIVAGQENPLDATVVYYGGGMETGEERLSSINWPILGIFGDQDQAIPVEMVKDLENSLDNLGIENEIYIYPGVGHAFANPSGQNYAAEATKDAWQKTINFLASHLK